MLQEIGGTSRKSHGADRGIHRRSANYEMRQSPNNDLKNVRPDPRLRDR
jgi:hypothetical protein